MKKVILFFTVNLMALSAFAANSIAFNYTGAAYPTGTTITALTTTVTGFTPTSYSISPSIPSGLTFNTSTGGLSGSTAITSNNVVYTITATDGTNSISGYVCFSFYSTSALGGWETFSATSGYSYRMYANSKAYISGHTWTGNNTRNNGSKGYMDFSPTNGYSNSIELLGKYNAAGIGFPYLKSDSITGGIDSIAFDWQAYQKNCNSSQLKFVVRIYNSKNDSITLTDDNQSLYSGETTGSDNSVNYNLSTGTATPYYAYTYGLPHHVFSHRNINFWSSTGKFVIRVWDLTYSYASGCTISTTADYDHSMNIANLKWKACAASTINYPLYNTFTINSNISSINPNTTGLVSSYSITPALPSGLLFNTTTGVISGTPIIVSPETEYTITANSTLGGSSTIKIRLTVVPNYVNIESFNSATNLSSTATYNYSTATGTFDKGVWSVIGGGFRTDIGNFNSYAAIIKGGVGGAVNKGWKLVSPTLSGGIDSLWFRWNSNGSESGNWNVTVQINGVTVGSITSACGSKLSNLPFYTFGVGDLNIDGNFTISIINNSDSTTSSKRFVIDNICWASPITASTTTTDLGLSNQSSDMSCRLSGIDTRLTINNSTALKKLTIDPGAQITLNDGQALTAGTLTLQSDATGTATFVNNGSTTILSTIVKQYLTTGRNWYVSIPVTSVDSSALSAAAQAIIMYDETSASWKSPMSSTLSPMKGYISTATKAAGAITFSGALNDGDQTSTLTRTYGVAKSGFNLVGNPYPSYVSWDAAEKSNLETTMWYRSKNAGNTAYVFDSYNALSQLGTGNNGETVNANIPPMQAIWVRVKAPVLAHDTIGTLTFRNSMRSHKGSQTVGETTVTDVKLKVPAVQNISQQVLRLQVSNGINRDETIVLFNPNASDGLDNYDSQKMSNNNIAIPEIYTMVGGESLVINGLSSTSNITQLPLGFTPGTSNTFTIKATEISNFDSKTAIFLRDDQLNTEMKLTSDSAYIFTSDASNTDTRFTILFKDVSITTDMNKKKATISNVNVYSSGNGQISISSTDGFGCNDQVSVYNSLGQKLISCHLTGSSTVLTNDLTSGVYLVTIQVNGEKRTEKVILK